MIPCHCKDYVISNTVNKKECVLTPSNQYNAIEICSPFCLCVNCIHVQIYYFKLSNIQIKEILIGNLFDTNNYNISLGHSNYFCPPPCIYNI